MPLSSDWVREMLKRSLSVPPSHRDVGGVVERGLAHHFVLPVVGRRPFVDVEVVRVAEVGPEELRRSAPVPSGSGPVILVAHEVVGVHQVEFPGEPAYGDLRVDPHLHLAGACGLGGYDDDAVAASRAVDGGQGRILQDVDGRDVGRRDIVDVVRLEAVNDIKRLVALGYRGAAAHADVDVRAGAPSIVVTCTPATLPWRATAAEVTGTAASLAPETEPTEPVRSRRDMMPP